ncbi:MAG: hypothetical protein IJD60_10680, partial [Clostridia bacterium]|nr:hypothetical protein [Clostridia bacterium]
AFIDCHSLMFVSIPEGVLSIGEGAFARIGNEAQFIVTRGSYAAQWAKEYGYEYTYPDVNSWLYE